MHGYPVSRPFDVLIMADDFTGACDTAAQFASPGRPCRILIEEPGARHDPGVRVVDTETRHATPAQAAAVVRRASSSAAIDRAGWPGLVYKKIDSTLRGNIAAELEALASALPRRILIVAPAFPSTGRTTRRGLCLVDGVPVDETEFARDARSPVRSARIADLLGFAPARGCSSAELAGLLPGAGPGAAFVVDAETDSDLDRIVSLLAEEPARYIVVGSAGLAAAIARLCGRADTGLQRTSAPIVGPPGTAAPPVLGLVGSLSERSRRQVEVVRRQERVVVVRLPEADRVFGVLAGGGQALVMTDARGGGDGREARGGREGREARGGRDGHDDEAALRCARALGAIARRAVEEVPGVRLFLTGGDTALAAVRALEAGVVDVHRQIVAGVPAITIPALAADRRLTVTAVTKAGGFGDDETIATAFRYLREE